MWLNNSALVTLLIFLYTSKIMKKCILTRSMQFFTMRTCLRPRDSLRPKMPTTQIISWNFKLWIHIQPMYMDIYMPHNFHKEIVQLRVSSKILYTEVRRAFPIPRVESFFKLCKKEIEINERFVFRCPILTSMWTMMPYIRTLSPFNDVEVGPRTICTLLKHKASSLKWTHIMQWQSYIAISSTSPYPH